MYDDVTLCMMMWHYVWWCDTMYDDVTLYVCIHSMEGRNVFLKKNCLFFKNAISRRNFFNFFSPKLWWLGTVACDGGKEFFYSFNCFFSKTRSLGAVAGDRGKGKFNFLIFSKRDLSVQLQVVGERKCFVIFLFQKRDLSEQLEAIVGREKFNFF